MIPNPIWLVSLKEEEIGTQTYTKDHIKVQREDSQPEAKERGCRVKSTLPAP